MSAQRLPTLFRSLISAGCALIFHASLQAAGTASPSPNNGDQPAPAGLAQSDWAGIRAAHETWKHEVRAVAGGWQALNPAQQWTTEFDGRGFEAKPHNADWTWGLELRSYGAGEMRRDVRGTPEVKTEGHRLAYHWDETVQEWFVNDGRGLEHGFTVQARPPGPGDAPLSFILATRGTLRAVVTRDARGVDYRNESGAVVLTYSGLRVWDADGRELAARFSAAPTGVELQVDAEGARYPLLIDPIAQQAYLKASNTEAADHFGFSIAISGDTVVVGAPREDSSATGVNGDQSDNSAREDGSAGFYDGAGAAYVFTRSGTDWSQQAYLKASNTEGATPAIGGRGDFFGGSVAISGDTVVIGAPGEDSSATGVNGQQSDNSAPEAGAAYVFTRTGTDWSQQAYLKASNADAYDRFGGSVAISGDTLVVGATGEQSSATGVNGNQEDDVGMRLAGAAYVFTRSGTDWSQQAYLKASNTDDYDEFGGSVAISGDTVAVGASRQGDAETLTAEGAAYIFSRSGTAWSQQAYLKASNAEQYDGFGASVAVSGDTVVVGAAGEDSSNSGLNGGQGDNSAEAAGAAYVFMRGGTTWSQQAYLKAPNADALDGFGTSVAICGDNLVVGAPYEDSSAAGVNGDQSDNSFGDPSSFGDGAGAAYVFTRSGTAWTQEAYLKASNTDEGDEFGTSATISGDTVVVGAPYEESNATGVDGDQANNSATHGSGWVESGAGAAYVFNMSPRLPVVFIHGVAGSVLRTKSGSDTIWPSITPGDVEDLNLATGPSDVEAVDTVREFAGDDYYAPFLNEMVERHGYREFQMQEDRRRMTNSHMSTLTGANKPDLFVFPYDWRIPNASHTATLNAYLQNISDLHDGAKVNLVVHSMGGLVMRRYLLDYGSDLIGRVVTVASPIWGAPESAYRMLTGCFFPVGALDYLNSSKMKKSVLSMPAVHELNPSTHFLTNWGLPVFTESGVDYNLNGRKQESYDSASFRALLDKEAYPQTPALNNISFHAGRQDDWSTDTNNVEFLHIVGRQAVDRTTVRINVRPKTKFETIKSGGRGIINGYGVLERVYGEGDGTVPILSAKRATNFYAPNTQVREITEPLVNKESKDQPEDQRTEHTAIMANTTVWNMIDAFLETGIAPPVVAPASPRRATAAQAATKTQRAVASSLAAPVLRITEIMSALNSGNDSAPYTPDWVEVTNYGSSNADLTGYRIRDAVSNGFTLNGAISIAPGESAVFIKTTNPSADIPAFRAVWNLPNSVKVGSYGGDGAPVLGANQDSAVLLNQSSTEMARAEYHSGTRNRSFAFVYSPTGTEIPTASPVSAIGEFGAYASSGSPSDVGSPGTSPPRTARQALLQTVSVGDTGNAADTNGFGRVDQDYRIGKFEVTIGQYAAFLNSVAKTDPYALYDTKMASDLNQAGIARSGSSGSFSYTVTGPSGWKPVGASSPANRPIVYVSWFDMARFCNWLHNGATNGADTETGAYALGGATNGAAPALSAGAKWRMPTENEWYKAAYYKGGGTNAGYWSYATRSSNVPFISITLRTTSNTANIWRSKFTVTESTAYETIQNYLTEAGAFNNSASAYGTFDQTGNVFELNDLTALSGTNRGLRGGSAYYNEAWAVSSYRWGSAPTTYQDYDVGFRVATIVRPEPSLAGLILSNGATTPVFAPQTQSYTASVPHTISSVSVTPTAADTDATITVNGLPVISGDPSPALSLNVGTNPINVVVTAGDGVASKAYSLLVTRAVSSDASLASLVLSSGVVSPDFDGATSAYTASVPYTTSFLTVTPTASEATASVEVNGAAVVSGSPSSAINLGVGPNTIDIAVTAPDGTTTRSYTVTVTRAEPTGRKQILVTGCGYVSIRDEQSGDENTLLSEIAARRIPGVEVVYNEEAGWVLMDFAADRHISVRSVPGKPAAEVEIMTLNAAGGVLDVQRFRSVAGSAPWRATVAPNQPASVLIDGNNDGTFAPGEQVAPDFSGNGPSIDMDPPDVQLVLSVVGNQLQLAATGADASAYNIRYQIDGGPLSTYAGPVFFSRDAQSQIALFAEDALGNTSGVINTRLNPRLSLQAGPSGSFFTMEWLEAEGYRLQSAENLQGPWTNVTAPQLLSNGRMSTTVTPPAGTRKAFYRLIAHPVSK